VARRKPGAQPGNRNAFKHGYYAEGLGTAGRKFLRRAVDLEPHQLAHEIAVTRARAMELVSNEPENLAIFLAFMRTITRMVAINYGLSKEETEQLHTSVADMVNDLMADREGAA